MSAELLPCPFCGNDGVFLDNYRNRWTVGCTNMECAAFSGFYQVHDNQQIAASLWNTRTPDLSFLDKPDVVKSVARFIDDYNCEDAKTIGGDYYEAWKEVRTYPDAHKMYKTRCLKMAEYVVEAIKRMAKEGK